ncbi:N-acetylmuramoyl-L-alanine amidase [Sedimentibacter acidaminivorans]|uniref:N-acetylmuramoyl-L-alanine amidase n=1 Tax=Sedimentibacter acidaminivorans TaxID=913099 RepID=A0ABS4GBJ8_9FIRM|nr:N-acetylmuramoyl-L-alanine amidase [Sedimentibacter acidaminivorans]MBP1925073.1 N-acetylmuramoyl-L-alanine amidase [Sedimentibacter acidaminivorans]
MEKFFKRVNSIFLIAIVIMILMTIYGILTKSTETIIDASNEAVNNQKIKILIDPGHGGVDPGTSGDLKIAEAPINLEISTKLMKFLEGGGFEAEMTRYEDTGLYTEKSSTIRAKKNEDLNNRVDAINNSNADLAISIHLNSFPQKQYYGAHVFYKKNCETSKIAAEMLQDNLKEILDKDNNRVPQAKKDIRIMDNSTIPTILIECGFLSNNEEEKKLITDDYQEKIAWAIYTGLVKYFNEQ